MLDEPYGCGRCSDDLGGVLDGESERYSQDEDFPLLGWEGREKRSHQPDATGVDELLAGRPFVQVIRVGVLGRSVLLGVRPGRSAKSFAQVKGRVTRCIPRWPAVSSDNAAGQRGGA